MVINLAHVSHLSSRAIGVLVAHHLRLDRTGGALRICLANPRVAVLLEQVRIGMLIDYHPTVEDAVIAAWPEPAGTLNRRPLRLRIGSAVRPGLAFSGQQYLVTIAI